MTEARPSVFVKGKIMKTSDFSAVVVAAGNGSRMRIHENKNFYNINGKPILAYTLKAIIEAGVEEIILVTNRNDITRCREIVDEYGFEGVEIVPGGSQRYDSAEAGLSRVTKSYVLIHDGARPLVTHDIIRRCMEGAYKYDACIAAVPVKDTIKMQSPVMEAGDNPRIQATPQRSLLWQAQTPQAFKTDLIREAYWKAYESNAIDRMTDDSQTVERMGRFVYLTEGDYTNIKITEMNDVLFAEAIINKRMGADF